MSRFRQFLPDVPGDPRRDEARRLEDAKKIHEKSMLLAVREKLRKASSNLESTDVDSNSNRFELARKPKRQTPPRTARKDHQFDIRNIKRGPDLSAAQAGGPR